MARAHESNVFVFTFRCRKKAIKIEYLLPITTNKRTFSWHRYSLRKKPPPSRFRWFVVCFDFKLTAVVVVVCHTSCILLSRNSRQDTLAKKAKLLLCDT